MSISIKIRLKNKPTKEGLYPIVLSIIKNRKIKVISLGIKCFKKDWDEVNNKLKKSDKNYIQRNRILLQKQEEALKIIDEFTLEGIDFTLNQFEERFRGKKESTQTVKQFWQEKIADLIKAGRTGNARAYRDTMNSFFKFVKRDNLMFREIDASILDKYETYLRSRGGIDGGIAVKMRELRAVYNDAINKDVVAKKYYPFSKYKISKLKGKGHKRALSRDEIGLIENLDIEKYPHLELAQQLFIFSYYTRGMNFYDIMKLKWENIGNDYITYTRSKTKGNFKIKILPPVNEILKQMRQRISITSYVFPLLLSENLTPVQIENRKAKTLKKFNKDLKLIAGAVGINKTITSYVARHSFATNMKQEGVSTDIISQSMGHQNISITTAYLKDFDDDILDNAHEKLLRETIPIYKIETNINQRLTSA